MLGNVLPTFQLDLSLAFFRGPYQPVLDFYPRTKFGKNDRSFIKSWFSIFKWIEYSPMVDRIFCFSCRVFDASDGRNSGQIDRTFSRIGFKNWNNATSGLRENQKSKHYINSTESLANYLNSKSIDVVLEESRIKT